MDVGSRDLLQWVNETPSTHRFIKKKEWDNLRSMFLGAMSGYNHTTNDEPGLYQREQQELLVSNLVRCNLRHKQPNGGAHEKSKQDDDMQRLAKKTMVQLQLGAIGKATRTLAAPPTSIVPPTADLIERLRDLFPMEQPSQRPQRAQYCVMRLDSSLVKDIVLKRMSRAAAPGPDGWTRELLVPIVKDKECLLQLTDLVRRMMSNECSPFFKARILATMLCPLAKPDGGVRPICPESALLKLASIAAARLLTLEETRTAISKHQYGVGSSAVVAVKMCRELLKTKPFAVALDARNAFNSISRSAILASVFEEAHLSPLRGIVDFSLGAESIISLRSGESFPCTAGVRQGSVLGPLLFAATVRPVIEAIERTGCSIVAYLDDFTMFAESGETIQHGINAAETALLKVSLRLNTNKCVAMHRDDTPMHVEVSNVAVAQSLGPTRILGAFCGTGSYEAPILERVQCKYTHLFNNICDVPLPICAKHQILRSSASCAMTFLIKTHEELDTRLACAFFDSSTKTTFCRITNLSEEEAQLPRTDTLLRLPTHMGGLGLPSQATIAAAARTASASNTTHKEAMTLLHNNSYADLLTSLSGPESAVLKSSTSWIADTQALMSDNASIVTSRMRLLLDVRQGKCKCPKNVAATNDHVMSCVSLSKIERHNAVVHTLARMFREVNLTVVVEPFCLGTESRARPDLSVTASTPFGTGVVTFATDIVVCHATTSKTVLSGKVASTLAAEGKMQRWGEWARNGNISFSPGVVTTTGTVTKNFRKWIFDVLSCSSLVGDEVAEKAHDISIALGVATMEATKKMFSFVC